MPETELVGDKVASPHIVEWQGQKRLIFAFGVRPPSLFHGYSLPLTRDLKDLSVKSEGLFVLRYTVFNVPSDLVEQPVPATCHCFGQPFRIYSTKEFPGLSLSTELTNVSPLPCFMRIKS